MAERASGMVRALAVAVMKLLSPVHRGTTWTWRCCETPPPAGRPRLRPTLMPSGEQAAFTARTASVTVAHSSVCSSAVRSSSSGTSRYGSTIVWAVEYG